MKSVQVAESAPVSQEESNSELQLEEMTATPNSRYRRPLHRRENKRFARRHLFTSKLLTVDTQSRHDPTMVRRNGCGAWLRC
ncbi:MAG: hypothetical protein O2955_05960 [Planctomycetota bacterium]|nr:hypothetical protein [Planctomycetota bacterium]MDA1212039.1 hypothetical protein [Planctomycetota bacterium]